MAKTCACCCKMLALSFPHLSGGVETRTNLKRWISPSLAPKLYITKTLKSWSVLDLKFKLDSMLTQGTAGLREHSSKRSLLRRRLEFSIVSIELNMLLFKGSYNQMTRHLSEHKYQCNVCLPMVTLLSLDSNCGISSLDGYLSQVLLRATVFIDSNNYCSILSLGSNCGISSLDMCLWQLLFTATVFIDSNSYCIYAVKGEDATWKQLWHLLPWQAIVEAAPPTRAVTGNVNLDHQLATADNRDWQIFSNFDFIFYQNSVKVQRNDVTFNVGCRQPKTGPNTNLNFSTFIPVYSEHTF